MLSQRRERGAGDEALDLVAFLRREERVLGRGRYGVVRSHRVEVTLKRARVVSDSVDRRLSMLLELSMPLALEGAAAIVKPWSPRTNRNTL